MTCSLGWFLALTGMTCQIAWAQASQNVCQWHEIKRPKFWATFSFPECHDMECARLVRRKRAVHSRLSEMPHRGAARGFLPRNIIVTAKASNLAIRSIAVFDVASLVSSLSIASVGLSIGRLVNLRWGPCDLTLVSQSPSGSSFLPSFLPSFLL